MWEAAISGYLVALSLIAAIGAQNAFVLRQGLRREHVGIVVAICALSDAVLISAGVAGFGTLAQAMPWFGEAMRWLGVAFLATYGAMRFLAARKGGQNGLPGAGPGLGVRPNQLPGQRHIRPGGHGAQGGSGQFLVGKGGQQETQIAPRPDSPGVDRPGANLDGHGFVGRHGHKRR